MFKKLEPENFYHCMFFVFLLSIEEYKNCVCSRLPGFEGTHFTHNFTNIFHTFLIICILFVFLNTFVFKLNTELRTVCFCTSEFSQFAIVSIIKYLENIRTGWYQESTFRHITVHYKYQVKTFLTDLFAFLNSPF